MIKIIIMLGLVSGILYFGKTMYFDKIEQLQVDEVKIERLNQEKEQEIKDTKKLNQQSKDFSKKWKEKKNELDKLPEVNQTIDIDITPGDHILTI